MPPKADPRDWDRLFRPNAPRRGGPLRILGNLLITLLVLLLIGGVLFVALRVGLERARQQAANQVLAETAAAEQLFAAQTSTATAALAATELAATALAATPTVEAAPPALGIGSVLNGGNLRSEPIISPETVIGQVCPGDQIEFLEQTTLGDGALWYRIRVTQSGPNCAAQQVTIGSQGWASASLLSELSPAP